MKKNKFMRLASALLVLTILTTCVISGTFAKYTTSDSSSDTARVAKFGVVITAANSSNFKTEYTHTTNGLTVQSSASPADNVVAPGTSGNAITFTISGTPEVATKIDINMTVNNDICVKAGDHKDYTTTDGTTFNLADNYYPVVFTLTHKGNTLVTGNLNDIETYLETTAPNVNKTYPPNAVLDNTYTLNWEWDFDANGAGTNDKADTLLGNVAAGTATDANVSTTLNYTISFTVRQVD